MITIKKKLIQYLENLPPTTVKAICYCLIIVVGMMDSVSGKELSSALFYVIPIAIAAWFVSFKEGIKLSVIASVSWYICDEGLHSIRFIGLWNTCFRFLFFSMVSYLISGYRDRFQEEELCADTDPLTGALNKRSFYEQVNKEISRAKRMSFPFSVAYIDLDNFKTVNDSFGHQEGDTLLISVVDTLKKHTRTIDLVSRLGGDEFAIMLVGTDVSDSESAIKKIQARLLKRMAESSWPVTFSIGIVTYLSPPDNVDTVIAKADNLMYDVKKTGKNNIAYASWPD